MNKVYQNVCQKVISGGQTGVDRGALDAAINLGFPCGGWCPHDRMAEDGKIDIKYLLICLPGGSYQDRTKQNIVDSDGTLIIYNRQLNGGTLLTFQFTIETGKPLFLFKAKPSKTMFNLERLIAWLNSNSIETLNIAGPRASEWHEASKIAFEITSKLISQLKSDKGY